MSATDERIDPKALRPGTVMRHQSGGEVVLSRRKEDGSGWWNTDGSGLADRVFNSGEWTVTGWRDKSGLAGHLQRLNLLLTWERSITDQLAAQIGVRVPSCGVVPVDQRARLRSERYADRSN